MSNPLLKFILPSLIIFVSLSIITLCVNWNNDYEKLNHEEYEEEAGTIPEDWNFNQRAFPYGKIDRQAFNQAYQYRRQKEINNASSNSRDIRAEQWSFCGPTNVGGRVTDIEISADQPQLLFVGTASGGIFRSDNWGETWTPIFDDALSLSIGDMAIAPSDQQIIYAGTGEPNAGGGSVAYDGNGVYKSIDHGDTWTHVGLDSIGSTGRIVIHPTDPNICYVGAMGFLFENNPDRGVFKTQNGGQTWQKILFINDSTGVIDLVIDPTDPNILYAATWQRVRRIHFQQYGGPASGIYKSVNGGMSWQKISDSFLGDAGRIGLAISASDPNIIVAAVCDPSGGLQGIYKTIDAGDNWNLLNTSDIDAPSYSYWFGKIFIHPQDPDVMFYTGLDMYKSINGGLSWVGAFPGAHLDQHSICFDPLNPETVLAGNDGGVYLSQTGGIGSHDKINNLPITQFYSCEIDNLIPERLYGGAQDNGTQGTKTGNTDDWRLFYFGDGFRVKVDYSNNNFMYFEYQYGNLARSTNGGSSGTTALTGISSSERKNWNTPIEMDPNNPSILYYGGQRVYKTTNRAVNWSLISPILTDDHVTANIVYGTLTAISASPVDSLVIYAGSDDGHLHVTVDGGNEWIEVSSNLPERWVTAIDADPKDAATAYVTFSGYRLGSNMAHVYKTTNFGQSWIDISGDLPDIPVNDIIVTPNERNLYIATDVGVFYSLNDGLTWELVGTGLPNVIVTDISYHPGEQFLVAATYGRGMYKISAEEVSTSVADISNLTGNINVYPNPASGWTTIEIPKLQGRYKISISDFSGKIVLDKTMMIHENFSFDASTWADGVYFMVLTDERGNVVAKTKLVKSN
ncbi:MAG TPA: T9SS type A sorting domain-containing protein [Saprospiraceae bacterium]|nr:T9SS type A sorting domain-containing protein [Saprospiraceae bacterium]